MSKIEPKFGIFERLVNLSEGSAKLLSELITFNLRPNLWETCWVAFARVWPGVF